MDLWTVLLFIICYRWQPQNFDALSFGFCCYVIGRLEQS
jgi:hypothetical protein